MFILSSFHSKSDIVYDAKFLQEVDEKLENAKNETPAADDTALSWPQTIFSLPGTSSSMHK